MVYSDEVRRKMWGDKEAKQRREKLNSSQCRRQTRICCAKTHVDLSAGSSEVRVVMERLPEIVDRSLARLGTRIEETDNIGFELFAKCVEHCIKAEDQSPAHSHASEG